MDSSYFQDHNTLLAIIKNLPGSYLVLLPDAPTYTIVEVSDEYTEVSYTKRKNLIGKGVFQVFPDMPGDEIADGEKNLSGSFQKVIDTKRKHEMLVQRYPIRLSGSAEFVERFWLAVNKPLVIDGVVKYILHSVTDITESKLLKSREQYFKSLADESPFMMWRTAGVSCIYVNDAWIQITGTTFEQNLGLGYLRAIHPDDLEQQHAMSLKAVSTQSSYESKYRIFNKNGEVRWVSMKMVPLHIDTSPVEFVTSLMDITDSEVANQRIKQSEELLRQLADAIIQMVWVTDANGMHEYYNQRWYDFTGTSYEEAEGEGWNQVFHPDDQQRAWNIWRHSLQTGTPYEIEYRLRKHTGEYIWVLGRAAPYFDEGGNIIKWFGTCTDINEQKLLQHQKDDFINIASHELKTPLTSLTANIQFIERTLLKTQPADSLLPKMVGSCLKNVKKLNKIIADLVDANSIGLGQLSINNDTFDIVKLITEAVVNLSASIEIKITGDPEVMVCADVGKIEQVIVNLVNNALKYAAQSEVIILHITHTNSEVTVSVTDQGNGIAEDKLKFLFDRYYRADVGDGKYSGMGLGLYVCANIIHSHGGSIAVKSKIGEGSTFWFTLPKSERSN